MNENIFVLLHEEEKVCKVVSMKHMYMNKGGEVLMVAAGGWPGKSGTNCDRT